MRRSRSSEKVVGLIYRLEILRRLENCWSGEVIRVGIFDFVSVKCLKCLRFLEMVWLWVMIMLGYDVRCVV